MDITETDDDKKRRLEVEKLQLEISRLSKEDNKTQKSPHWIFGYLQPLIPTIFTVASLIITIVLLSRSHLFEANNKFLQAEKENLNAQKENLIRDIKDFRNTKDSLNGVIEGLNNTISRQRADLLKLQNENKTITVFFAHYIDSLKPKERQFAQTLIKRDSIIAQLTKEKDKEAYKLGMVGGNINKFIPTWNNFVKQMDEGVPFYKLRSDLEGEVKDILNAWKYNQ
jgi:hypothetical protein